MNQEQFGQFWAQLKAPLRAKWKHITEEDLVEVHGELDRFGTILQRRYGDLQHEAMATGANRLCSHWSGY